VATDDRDTPAGAAEGTRADMPAGAPATDADHGNPGVGSGSPGSAEAAAGRFPPADAGPEAGQAVPESVADGAPGPDNDASASPATVQQSDERQDDDLEPFLPPGPNPFSSVHPQGTPPYRPAANGGYPGEPGDPEAAAASLRPADPRPAAPGPAAPGPGPAPGLGPDAPGRPAVAGGGAGSDVNGLSVNGPGADGPGASGLGASGLGASRQPPDVREPGQPGYAERGHTPVSPYPPVPDDEPDVSRPAHGGVSPYPVYRPYDPGEDDGAGDAMTDYGLPSPQAYGFAPPPPPAEPLPDLGIPEQGYRNDPPGYRDEAPGREDRGQPAGSAPGRARPGGGHRRTQGMAGQHRAGAPENGVRSAGLRGPAPAAPPPLGMPPGRTVPGRGYPPPGAAPSGAVGPLGPAPLAPSGPSGPPGPPQPRRPHPASAQHGAPEGMMPGGDDDGEDYPPLDAEGMHEHETADSLTAEALLQGRRPAPGAGWRRTIFKATGGMVRVGESASSQRRRELIWRARTPVAGGHHRVAVMSLKGGVGKTTTTVGLGATLATLRGDRVIAVDANPDRGTLSDKVRLETSATVRDLLNERQQVHRYADVRAFTSQASSRLEVLASDRDPAVSVAFSEADYCDVAGVLEHYYSICITDCGTGLLHSAMTGVLSLADQIVLVSSPSVDGARSASATLDWLDAHGYGDLVRNAVVVLSTVRPRSKSTVDLDRLEQHFAARCRAVVRIPYDGHLEEGAEVELEQLSPATTEAYLRLAATVGEGLAWPRRALQRPTPTHP
jgi:MinD-like ATPase involved in chromosome partitioning or flagellar assembly